MGQQPKRETWFTTQRKRFGDNWLIGVRPSDIIRNSDKIINDICRCNIQPGSKDAEDLYSKPVVDALKACIGQGLCDRRALCKAMACYLATNDKEKYSNASSPYEGDAFNTNLYTWLNYSLQCYELLWGLVIYVLEPNVRDEGTLLGYFSSLYSIHKYTSLKDL